MPDRERVVGRTRDVGWQVGVRKTLAMTGEEAWREVTSPDGVALWLGAPASAVRLQEGNAYELRDGTTGAVRVYAAGSHLRLTWHPAGWARASTIQVRVIPKGSRAVIAFHQEHLPTAAARGVRRRHFAAVLARLADRPQQR